jgi:ABC-type thiamin/hydroxymethylpyrimidine transport system permease subunit
MFLHFIVAGIFLIFGMIAYSNYTMSQPILMDGIIMSIMVIVWFLLYFIAKQIRERGNDQMHDLEKLYEKIVG